MYIFEVLITPNIYLFLTLLYFHIKFLSNNLALNYTVLEEVSQKPRTFLIKNSRLAMVAIVVKIKTEGLLPFLKFEIYNLNINKNV